MKDEMGEIRGKLGRKRILLSIEQKRRLVTKGKIISRELLSLPTSGSSPRRAWQWFAVLRSTVCALA
jgi:hypothetical protein